MSDLIRREDVTRLVNQFVFGLCKEQNDEVIKIFNKYIEKIPTAYDIDKVVKKFDKKYSNSLWFTGNEEFSITRNELIEILKEK